MTRPVAEAGPAATLTASDLLAGGAVLLVALLGWASLALAHLAAHSLPAVLVLTCLAAAAAVVAARRLAPRPAVRRDRAGLAVSLGCAAVIAALTFPGFSYGVADKDPGGYVSHAAEIAHSGSYSFTDPVLASGIAPQLSSPFVRLPGIWVRGRATIVPQFYHLWPALLATAWEVAGTDGIRWAVPVTGVLSVLCLVALLLRIGTAIGGRAAGLAAGASGGLLLATNMLEVWQARYPTTELLAQVLFVGALLGVVVALQTRWRPAAGAAGLLVGVGWLNRADGLLLVLLSAGIGAALLATRRWDARATWFTAGLAVVLPHAVLQAYHLALPYSRANAVPSLAKVAALCAGLLVLALLLRPLLPRVARAFEGRRVQVRTGVLVCLGAVGLLALGFLRARLFGVDYFSYNGRRLRSYDEAILRRLGWFFTLPGYALMVLGLAVVALRRWRAPVWVAVLPTLVLFPLYGYSARNSTRLLWWGRRYVPTVLPGVLVLVALALAFAFVWQFRGRAWLRLPAVLALAGLLWAFLGESLPLRAHDEWAGSFRVTARLAALSGGRPGIYLWDPNQPCCEGPTALFAVPVWLQRGEVSALLPVDPTLQAQALQDYEQHFPGRPIFVVAAAGLLPGGVPPARVRPVDRITTALPMWDETQLSRPSASHLVRVDVSVWRVTGT